MATEPRTLDPLAPAALAVEPPPEAQPSRLERMHAYMLSKEQPVPADLAAFSEGMRDPERRKRVYEFVREQPDAQVPDDYAQFEAGLFEGEAEKKSPDQPLVPPSGSGSPMDGAPSGATEAVAPGMPEVQLPPVAVVGREEEAMGGPVRSDFLPTEAEQLAALTARQSTNPLADLAKGGVNAISDLVVGGAGSTVEYLGNAAKMGLDAWDGIMNNGVGQSDLGQAISDAGKAVNREAQFIRRGLQEPLSAAGKQDVFENPNANNLSAMAGSALGSLGAVLATGGYAALPMAVGQSMDAAKKAGVSDEEAVVLTTWTAPLVALLDRAGAGSVGGSAGKAWLVQTVTGILRRGGREITEESVKQVAGSLLKEATKQTGKAFLKEGGTEAAQSVVSEEGKALADLLRGGEEKYGVKQWNVAKQAALEGVMGGAIGAGVKGAGMAMDAGSQRPTTTPADAGPGAFAALRARLRGEYPQVTGHGDLLPRTVMDLPNFIPNRSVRAEVGDAVFYIQPDGRIERWDDNVLEADGEQGGFVPTAAAEQAAVKQALQDGAARVTQSYHRAAKQGEEADEEGEVWVSNDLLTPAQQPAVAASPATQEPAWIPTENDGVPDPPPPPAPAPPPVVAPAADRQPTVATQAPGYFPGAVYVTGPGNIGAWMDERGQFYALDGQARVVPIKPAIEQRLRAAMEAAQAHYGQTKDGVFSWLAGPTVAAAPAASDAPTPTPAATTAPSATPAPAPESRPDSILNLLPAPGDTHREVMYQGQPARLGIDEEGNAVVSTADGQEVVIEKGDTFSQPAASVGLARAPLPRQTPLVRRPERLIDAPAPAAATTSPDPTPALAQWTRLYAATFPQTTDVLTVAEEAGVSREALNKLLTTRAAELARMSDAQAATALIDAVEPLLTGEAVPSGPVRAAPASAAATAPPPTAPAPAQPAQPAVVPAAVDLPAPVQVKVGVATYEVRTAADGTQTVHSPKTGKPVSDASSKAALKALARLAPPQQADTNVPQSPAPEPEQTRTKDGVTYTRQARITGPMGSEAQVEFATDVLQPVRYALVEASELQPSHTGGTANQNHFITGAQPKNRTDDASQNAIDQIAKAPDLARTSESPNAYSGAPIVNARAEAIQGNGRAEGIRRAYRNGTADAYRAGVVAKAESLGLDPTAAAAMREPVLVRVADVDDATAVTLGRLEAADIESGGQRGLSARHVAGRISEEQAAKFGELLGRAGVEASLTEAIRAQTPAILNLLEKAGALNPTQRQTLVRDNELTPEGVEQIGKLAREVLFRGGDAALPEIFAELPDAAQNALNRALPYLLGLPAEASITPEVQNATIGLREWQRSGQLFDNWLGQRDMFAQGLSASERFSPLEIALMRAFATEKRPTILARKFAEYAALVRGREATFFEPAVKQTKDEAAKTVFNADPPTPSAPRPAAGGRPAPPQPPSVEGPQQQAPPAGPPDGTPASPGAEGVNAARATTQSQTAPYPGTAVAAGRIQPASTNVGAPTATTSTALGLFRRGAGLTLRYNKKPGGGTGSGARFRRRALGTYQPNNAVVQVRPRADLNVTSHEIGHYLDDQYDLLGRAGSAALAELDDLAQYGSTPPTGHPNPQEYQLGEGVAEYVRAYLVNPAEAASRYPAMTAILEARVPATMRAHLDRLGQHIQAVGAATAGEQIRANVGWAPGKERKGVLAAFFAPRNSDGFGITALDRLAVKVTDSARIFEKAMAWAAQWNGRGEPTIDRNPAVLARLFLGHVDKALRVLSKGMVNGRNQRLTDDLTGAALNLDFLYGAFTGVTAGDLEAKARATSELMIAERTVEYYENGIRDQITAALNAGATVDPALLASNPRYASAPTAVRDDSGATLTAQQANEVNTALGGRLAKLDLSDGDVLTGIGHGLYKDLDVARARIVEAEAARAAGDTDQAEYDEAARRYRVMADANLRYLVEKGRYSQEQYEAIKARNLYYVAMQRVLDAEPDADLGIAQGRGQRQGLASGAQLIKKATGSGREIRNPFLSLTDAVAKTIREGDRNDVLRAVTDLLTSDRQMYDGAPNQLGRVGHQVAEGTKDALVVYRDGVAEHWAFDEEVRAFLTDVERSAGSLPVWLTAPGALTRWTVTHAPQFLARNTLRDVQDVVQLSHHNPSLREAGALAVDREAFTNVDDARMLYGGGQAGHEQLTEQEYYKAMQQSLRKAAGEPNVVLLDPKTWGRSTLGRALLHASEAQGRNLEYQAAFRHAKTTLQLDDYQAGLYAAYHSRDILDFAVAGTWVRQINQAVPFTNAAVQGTRRLIRSWAAHPGATSVKLLKYGLLPAALNRLLVAAMGRDDDYEELPAYRRDFFFNIPAPTGDGWIIIPKPFAMGVLGSLGDRALSAVGFNEADAFDGVWGSLAGSLVPVDETAMLGGFKPLIEATTGRDLFRDKYIISPFEKELAVEVRRGTTRASRLGQAAQAISFDHVDARNVDHIVQGYGTYFGQLAMGASDVGRDDRTGLGWQSTGLFKPDNPATSKVVDGVQKGLAEAGFSQSATGQLLEDLIGASYAATTDADKQATKAALLAYARRVRARWTDEQLRQLKKDKQRLPVVTTSAAEQAVLRKAGAAERAKNKAD